MMNTPQHTKAIYDLIERVIGENKSQWIDIQWLTPVNDHDVFELKTVADRLVIRGTSGSAIASGFYWYLKHECHSHISWCGDRVDVPLPLPAVSLVRKETPYKYRYNLNYCTFSYSMAFWDWERWEREIDWMALNGVNLVLSLVGHEEVWRRLLTRIGFSDEQCKQFICGPAFFAWQWMQNMTSWGGPLPDWWFEERVELARKIHDRMIALGIMPILQGYSGMIPIDFKSKYPKSEPVGQGKWCEFDRPSLLLPSDPMYKEVASIFYEEQKALFGEDIHFYSTDPFHEGGSTEGIDVTAYAREMQREMLKADPQAIWVLQAWQDNPKDALLQGLDKSRVLILDLWCESDPAWKQREAFQGTPWIWCMIQNYGGKNGLFGNLDLIANELPVVLNHSQSGLLAGIGLAMEGIETNPVMYDLLTDMIWRTKAPDVKNWLDMYIQRRYGKLLPIASEAWAYLRRSVYNCNIVQQGATESILCARPAADITSVSTWGPTGYYYEKSDVREASKRLFECFEELKGSEGYLYDLVDVTRQAVADLARETYHEFISAFQNKDLALFDFKAGQFLQLVGLQDKLLGTCKEFLLGRWIADARELGRSDEDKDWLEFNARTLITLWGTEQSQQPLHDYSHREWSGLIADFYYPRWAMYIASLRHSIEQNQEAEPIDWYEWEYRWTRNTNPFVVEPTVNMVEIMEEIIPLLG
ncbi:alpha-N-acetylglucosaminidase [Cohnella silvisoli]|uniref:Alpha-N-acetylglucosaminidase n=1 Tax=Cohnella silvisoli TaxID=2873699 RepID=A0ABV1L1J9_9BACL|nr:alpha-N-acetylglucosaminidase [Cohnella silvisoli]MCD9025425.1 alpha-N-acetylglucosaminidase [Cohnella silvisoli]